MDAPETFVHHQRGGCFALAILALIFPAMGVFAFLEWAYEIPQGPLPAIVIVAVAALAYFAVRTGNRVVIDAQGLRFTHTTTVFGIRRAEKIAWALPAAELTSAREVTTRSPSSRGGWNTTVVLHFPGDRKILEVELGLKGAPSGAYDALVASLRRRLGDAFTAETLT